MREAIARSSAFHAQTSRLRGISVPHACRTARCVGFALTLAASLHQATAQEARLYQLSEQVLHLRQQDNAAEATPLAPEAVTVARATYGPENPQVRLSLNEFGLLLKDQEKFAGGSLRPHRLLRPRLYPHRKYKSLIYNTWTPSHCAP